MFLIEALFTLVIGIALFFLLAPSPSQTKAAWRPNGIFTDREAKIAVMRIIRDEPQKGASCFPLPFPPPWAHRLREQARADLAADPDSHDAQPPAAHAQVAVAQRQGLRPLANVPARYRLRPRRRAHQLLPPALAP